MRPSLRETQDVLKVLREAILGLSWVERGDWIAKDNELEKTIIVTIMETVAALDFFLTRRLQNRTEDDAANALKLIGGIDWRVLLSDDESTLLLRRPTEQDLEVVSLEVAPPEIKREWKRLNVRRSQATEFR